MTSHSRGGAGYLGWQVVDPGAPPLSPLIDDVPDTPDPDVQLDWRRNVKLANAALENDHARQPLWFPVLRPTGECFIPFFGGKPSTWQAACATLTAALLRSGFDRVRVADLTRANALGRLHDLSAHPSTRWCTEVGTVSPRGSSIDVLFVEDIDELTTVIADTVGMVADSAAGFDTGSVKQTLLRVGRVLQPPVRLTALAQAVEMVLTNAKPAGATFNAAEEAGLRQLWAETGRRPVLQQDLDRLERNLGSLTGFSKVATKPRRLGQGAIRVKTIQVESTGSAHEFLVGQQVLAHYLTRMFERPDPAHAEALIVIGADALADHMLESLVATANRERKQLFLMFEHLDDHAKRYLGGAGSRVAVFFSLQNADEAEVAARHLGREYKFVVNGRSISEGESDQWSSTETVSSDRITSRALSFGSNFGRTLTRGFNRGESHAVLEGGGRSRDRTETWGRVHEYVLEPEQFQQLPDTAMLVIQDKRVTLADCEPSIRALPLTANRPYERLGEGS